MMKYRIFAGWIVPALAWAIFAAPARAQDPIAAAAAVPIVSEVASTVVSKPKPKPNGEWLKAEVIHADSNSILVREQANGMMIHSFTFAAPLKDKMTAIVSKGGYQYGDKVKIRYMPGQTEALEIKGKPSKPI
jgi:hypothetical protein